jgi:hypothetical protein
MKKGTLKKNELKLLYHGHQLDKYFENPLFVTDDDEGVWPGDTVEFYVDGDHMPHNGIISNRIGLRVDCYNTLLDKWQYYEVEQ